MDTVDTKLPSLAFAMAKQLLHSHRALLLCTPSRQRTQVQTGLDTLGVRAQGQHRVSIGSAHSQPRASIGPAQGRRHVLRAGHTWGFGMPSTSRVELGYLRPPIVVPAKPKPVWHVRPRPPISTPTARCLLRKRQDSRNLPTKPHTLAARRQGEQGLTYEAPHLGCRVVRVPVTRQTSHFSRRGSTQTSCVATLHSARTHTNVRRQHPFYHPYHTMIFLTALRLQNRSTLSVARGTGHAESRRTCRRR